MTFIPSRDPIMVNLSKTEQMIAMAKQRKPLVNPGNISDKAEASRVFRGHFSEHIRLTRKVDLMKRDLGAYHLDGVNGHQAADGVLKLDSKVEDYVRAYPECRGVFEQVKVDNRLRDPENNTTKLVDLLKKDPEFGEKLGAKTTHLRLAAQIENGNDILAEYKTILAMQPELVEAGKLGVRARAANYINSKRHKLGWWVKDNPIQGGGSAVALGILVKLSILLLFVDVIEGGHKKKKQAALSGGQPATASPQQPQRPTRAPQPQPQPAQQQLSPQQAFAYPAPYLAPPAQPMATPLQTALNMTY